MAIIYGTTSADKKIGTLGDDLIHGWAKGGVYTSPSGNDTLDGAAGNDSLYGGTGNDSLIGGIGNDLMDGNAGADIFDGGTGNDIYVIDITADKVTEAAGAGTDTIRSYVSYTLGANLENLALVGTSAINGIGNSLNNMITGNRANNVLDGGGGNDTLDGGDGFDTYIGGTGNDTYIVDTTTDIVTESTGGGTDTVHSSVTYTLGANLENLTLTGSSAISGTGNALNNSIRGNAASENSLYGGEGNDTLNGGSGEASSEPGANTLARVDSLYGGTGDDTYIINSVYYSYEDVDLDGIADRTYIDTDYIIEGDNEGVDTVKLSINAPSYSQPIYHLHFNVENLILTGSSDISGGGNTLDNIVTGNSGSNSLYGDQGNDLLQGGGGNDELTDLYYSNFRGSISIRQGGADTMLGGAGEDTLYGLDGNDYLSGDNGNDTLLGDGFYQNDVPVDTYGLDTLTGGNGNDYLVGGNLNDTLTGGAGADTFGYTTLSDGLDIITDFVVADDTIQVSASGFSDELTPGVVITTNQFVLSTAAVDDSDRFIYDQNTGALFFDVDGTGTAGQVQFASLSTGLALTNADIVVV